MRSWYWTMCSCCCIWMIGVQTSASAENIIQYSNDLSPSALQNCLLELFAIYLVSCDTLMVHAERRWIRNEVCSRLVTSHYYFRELGSGWATHLEPAFHHSTDNSFAQQLDMSSPAFHPQLLPWSNLRSLIWVDTITIISYCNVFVNYTIRSNYTIKG